ncbi:TPA: hypothetical protein DCE37_26440 [Candidatus Latescibacteria bacterium]|nr:hypothetical protein [Candidatus Latescibacterota bacterium]
MDANGVDQTYTSKTYVELAVENGFGAILDLLVAHGADRPELFNAYRYRISVVGGDEGEARRLLEGDPSLSDQPGVLIQAALQGEIDRARLILDRGAECKIRSNDHDPTPIRFANHAGRLEARDYLVELTRDAHDQARFGNTSWLLDVLEDDSSRAKVALSNGMTALHIVPETEDTGAVIDKLLACGADIDKKNDDGKTPLVSGEASERTRVAELLRTRGSSV